MNFKSRLTALPIVGLLVSMAFVFAMQAYHSDRSDHVDSLSSLKVELLKSQKDIITLKSQIDAADRDQQINNDLVASLLVDIEGEKRHVDPLLLKILRSRLKGHAHGTSHANSCT